MLINYSENQKPLHHDRLDYPLSLPYYRRIEQLARCVELAIRWSSYAMTRGLELKVPGGKTATTGRFFSSSGRLRQSCLAANVLRHGLAITFAF